MMFFQNLNNRFFKNLDDPDNSFWLISIFFTLILIWAFFFEVDRSVNVEGLVSPLGKPIIIQNRFEGKVLETIVQSGDRIKKGDILARFETEEDSSTLDENKIEISKLSLELRRLNNQLVLDSNLISKELDDDEFYKDQVRVLNAEINSFVSEQKVLDAEKSLKESELQNSKLQFNGLQDKLTVTETKFEAITKLYERGFEGKIKYLETVQGLSEVKNEILQSELNTEKVQGEIDLINQKKNTNLLNFQRKTSEQLAEVKKQLELVLIRGKSLDARLGEYSIISPENGVISKTYLENVGAVIPTATKIFEIIPDNKPLVFYSEVPVQSITDVKLGQAAKIILSSMDTRKNIALEGEVIFIENDATENDEGKRFYSAVISIFKDNKNQAEILPGVSGTASILQGRRTIMDYFLEPILESMTGSLSEN